MAELCFCSPDKNPLLLAWEQIEDLSFDNLTIAGQMNVLYDCIKEQFAYDVAQFAVLASFSSDQYQVALGFKQ